jgi:hypothetical protein
MFIGFYRQFVFSQDTNTMQYELMRYIGAAHGCITVVGDPDQSSMFSVVWSDRLSDAVGQYMAGDRLRSKIFQRCAKVSQ